MTYVYFITCLMTCPAFFAPFGDVAYGEKIPEVPFGHHGGITTPLCCALPPPATVLRNASYGIKNGGTYGSLLTELRSIAIFETMQSDLLSLEISDEPYL